MRSNEKRVTESELVTRNKYRVPWVSRFDIQAGQIVTEEMLILKNPGTGIPAYRKCLIVGKKARIDIPADTLIQLETLI